MKEPIILVGGGGHCISAIDVIESSGRFEIVGIVDVQEKVGGKVLGYPVIGTDEHIPVFVRDCQYFHIATGQIRSSVLRERLFNLVLDAGGTCPAIVSAHAYVSKYAKINDGTIVMHWALINANAEIGKCSIVNSKALLEHEVRIGAFSHISTGAIINGQAVVGDRCFVGSNAVIANNISIASEAIVGAGSVVVKDIDYKGIYAGNPVRKK